MLKLTKSEAKVKELKVCWPSEDRNAQKEPKTEMKIVINFMVDN